MFLRIYTIASLYIYYEILTTLHPVQLLLLCSSSSEEHLYRLVFVARSRERQYFCSTKLSLSPDEIRIVGPTEMQIERKENRRRG